MYRCVIANETNAVLAVGRDENQSGQDFRGIGVWSTFTFESIPEPSEELWLAAEEKRKATGTAPVLIKVVENGIALKEIAEL